MQLHIRIKPNSKENHLSKNLQGHWVLRIKSPPVDGKANNEACSVLGKILKLPKSAITLTGGHTHPTKKFRIDVLSEAEVLFLLEAHLETKK